jgi:ABC-type lipoprotein export system ATPase subunit
MIDYLTVRENVALVARAAGSPRIDAESRADELLVRLGIAALADRLPGALSAGESQRAALARAMILRPAVVLADEPTAHLDAAAGAAVAAALRAVTAADGAALVVVTHDVRLAAIGDRRFALDDGRLAPA